jgi:hypothetical protein
MKNYSLLFSYSLTMILYGANLEDNYSSNYSEEKLVSFIEFYDNDRHKILYIDYFVVFPKYERVIRDNYYGYQNNCIDSRIYFIDGLKQVYEVYFNREKCNGTIEMIVDKTGIEPLIQKRNREN